MASFQADGEGEPVRRRRPVLIAIWSIWSVMAVSSRGLAALAAVVNVREGALLASGLCLLWLVFVVMTGPIDDEPTYF